MPTDFNGVTDAETSAQVGIVEFFDDDELTQLILQGLTQNQELRIRNQEIRIANNEILARRGAFLPFITLGAFGGFDKTSRFTPLGAAEDQLTYPVGGKFPDPLPNTRLSADMTWSIDLWGEFRNARDAAIQRFYGAIEGRNYLITQLVAETAQTYYELAALDQRLVYLNQTIEIQKRSLEAARAQKDAGTATELPVQRFLAEVRKNESERTVIRQQIIEAENRINFLVGRFPQQVDRVGWDFVSLDSQMLRVGVPAQLLQNRRDIREAEREVAASGLDVLSARARFYPRFDISAGVGFEAFNPKFLFDPEAFVANTAGELVAPLINKSAIRAEYLNANSRQLQAIYEYQRTILNAYTEVVNRMARVENYRQSVELKQQQVLALEESVNVATNLFVNVEGEYLDVLFSQRDLLEARQALIEAKLEQLSAIVAAYQALGGGYLVNSSGLEFAELFCHPYDLMMPEEILPATTNGEDGNGEGQDDAMPLPNAQPIPLPSPSSSRRAPELLGPSPS